MNAHLIGHVLRRTGLLRAAYEAAFWLDVAKNYQANRNFERAHPGFTFPPLRTAYEQYTTISYEIYFSSGRKRAAYIYKLMNEHMPDGPLSLCDWGCGCGRVVRHLPTLDKDRAVRAFGTDYNAAAIKWCRENIQGIAFKLNRLEPPLDFKDGELDGLYSLSVFTHIPGELQTPWLQENLRVVRPGGLVLMTLMGDSYKHRLLTEERERYESEGIVIRGGVKPGWAWYTAYHNPKWVEQTFFKGLDVVYREVYPEGGGQHQDIWIVRKPH